MSVTDQACNVGQFPIVLPPPPGSTPHAGVTVRYLAAQPPLAPTARARSRPCRWTRRRRLRVVAAPRRRTDRPAWRQAAQAPQAEAVEPVPGSRATAPGVAAAALRDARAGRRAVRARAQIRCQPDDRPTDRERWGRRAAAHVLVVLPALTWQGANPVDDNGDGLPDTLTTGDVDRPRPAAGRRTPAGFARGGRAAELPRQPAHPLPADQRPRARAGRRAGAARATRA